MNSVTKQIILPDFKTNSGVILEKPHAAYTIYGDFNDNKSRALIFHGFSSNSELHTWWEKFNFSEMAQNYNIICINSLSSSHGTTCPESINPINKIPYHDTFPNITIQDTVNFAVETLKQLELNHFDLIFGCSLGGMQTLDMYLRYPEISKRFISVAGIPVPYMTKLTNIAQAMLIDSAAKSGSKTELEKALGLSRFFFRLSCTNEKALELLNQKFINDNKLTSLVNYFIEDNIEFQTKFSPYSNSILLKMMAYFELHVEDIKMKSDPELTMISIEHDSFTPEKNVKMIYEKLLKNMCNVSHKHFDTDFGHEAWIIDGKRFYDFIKNDLYR